MTHRIPTLAVAVILILAGCEQHEALITEADISSAIEVAPRVTAAPTLFKAGSGDISPYLAALNEQLAAEGANYAVKSAEWLSLGSSENPIGQTVFANDRMKRLDAQWVPGDPRGASAGTADLNYSIFIPLRLANSTGDPINAEPVLHEGYQLWLDETSCSGLHITGAGTGDFNSGILLLGGNPGDPSQADINEVGFLPAFIFDDVLGPGASEGVLGVTFTFVWVDAAGNRTDIDNDGNEDVAFKEIWYNNAFTWAADGSNDIDILSVAAHEQGHALGFGHFGKLFVTNNNGKLHVSPRALMNAAYLAPYQQIAGSDNASFCSVYGSWPD